MPETEAPYITTNRVVTALAAVVIIVAGWVFNLLAGAQTEIRNRQARYGERIAVLETRLEHEE